MSTRVCMEESTFGKSEDLHFNEKEEGCDVYLERLEQFLANRLTYGDEKSKTVFLTIVGKKTHTLLMALCAPLKL